MSRDGPTLCPEKITLPTILPRGDERSARTHALPDDVRRAVWAILTCRTALRGGPVQGCPAGPIERIWYNSCGHRLCPPWAWLQIERWLARQKSRLLACEHDHVICILPHERNDLWLVNVTVMTQRLCASVHATLVALLGDAKYLGAKPGVIAPLHTWRPTRLLHRHIHALVTGGGLKSAGQWGAVWHGLLGPMRIVMAVVRGKLLASIRQEVELGRLTPPQGKRRQQVENRLNRLGRQQWNVHICERSPDGQGVLMYLARYLRGGPISNARLLSCEGQQVVFR
jgi:hypothetical protein